MTIEQRLDQLTDAPADPMPEALIPDSPEPVQLAGPLSAIKGILKGAKKADDIKPPKIDPALEKPPPMPEAPVAPTPPAAPPTPAAPATAVPRGTPKPLTQPQQVEKLLTPKTTQDIRERAAARASAEAAGPPPGYVRTYHGGAPPDDPDMPLWVTVDLNDAKGWASRDPNMKVWYVDVPESMLGRDMANGIVGLSRLELPPELAKNRKLLGAPGQAAAPLGKPPEELFNYLRMALPDDAKLLVDETAKAAGVKTPARVTHAEILEDLQAKGFKPADLDWLVNYADDTQTMKRVATAGEIFTVTAKMTQDLGKQLLANPSPELALKYHQSTVLLGQVTKGLKNVRVDHARALGIMRAEPTGDVAALESVLASVGGMDNIVQHAGKLANLDLTNQRNLKRLADMAEASMWSKSKDIWITTWINGMLSSPVTHAKNILGNTMFDAIQVPERFVAGAFGRLRGAEVGDRVELTEAASMLQGAVAGQVKALEAFGKAFIANAPVTTSGSKLQEAGATITNFGEHLGLGGMLGRAADAYGQMVTIPGRTLLAEDEYFKTVGYYTELYAQASRRAAAAREAALDAGKSADEAREIAKATRLDVIENPPEDISAAAWDTARYVTFTEQLAPGSFERGIERLAQSNVVARMYMPFVRTPINIAAATLERTPFAPLTRSFRAAMAEGGTARDIALARVAVGTSLLTTAVYVASTGRITGSGPGDRGEREALERSGWQAYSIMFEPGEVDASTRDRLNEFGRVTDWNGKVLWSFQGLEPLGGILAIAANYADYARYEDDVGLVEQVGMGAAFGMANYAMDLPYLQGMSEFVQALTGQGDGKMTPSTVKRMLNNFAKTATTFAIEGSPAGVYSSARAVAERMGNPEASDVRPEPDTNKWARGIVEAMNRYKSRTPGLSDNLPPKTNRWGEPIRYGDGAPYEVISPIRIKVAEQKDVDRIWLEYNLPRGQPSRQISWPERKDLAGIKVEMPPEAFNELKRIYAWEIKDGQGRNVQDAIADTVKDRAFERMTFDRQQKMLLAIDGQFMNAARSRLMNDSQFAPLLQEAIEQEAIKVQSYGLYSDEVR